MLRHAKGKEKKKNNYNSYSIILLSIYDKQINFHFY